MTIPLSAITKSAILLLGLFTFGLSIGQNSLQAYKLSVYEDAARISYKGVINFSQQRADIPLAFQVPSDGIDLATSSGRIAYYRVRVDSVVKRVAVSDWTDILRANISKRVTVVYQIGQEFDDVDGDVRYVNDKAGLLLLHGVNNTEYFIPLDQIKQVLVEHLSEYRVDKKVPETILEVGIDTDIPALPMEMFMTAEGITWEPTCRLRIVGSNKAKLQMQAIIHNNLSEFKDVDIELNAGSLLQRTAGNEVEPIPAGKLSVRSGDKLILNLRDLELDYESAFQCAIPWKNGVADNKLLNFDVANGLRLVLPANTGLPCGSFVVVDEHNRHLANITGQHIGPDGAINLNMGNADDVRVALVEREVKRDGKALKIGDKTYERVSIEGKLVCQNFGTKYAQIMISRELLGEVTEASKGQASASPNAENFGPLADYVKILNWKVSVDKGQKKEIIFSYDTFIAK